MQNSQWTRWALDELDELSMNSMSSRWTLNEQCPYQLSLFTGRLSMQNSQWTLNGQCPYKSLNGQLSRDKGLYCLTMEIVYWTTFNVSTLNGQWTSIGHPLIASTLNGQLDILYLGRKGDKKIQWKCGHLQNLPLQPTPKQFVIFPNNQKHFFPFRLNLWCLVGHSYQV